MAGAELDLGDLAVAECGESGRIVAEPQPIEVIRMDQVRHDLVEPADADHLLGAVAEDRAEPVVDPDRAIEVQVDQIEDRGIGLGQALDEVLAVARLLLGPPALADLRLQRHVDPLELGRALVHPHLQLVVGQPQGLLGALLVVDVGARAEPADDLATLAVLGQPPDQKPAKGPVPPPQPLFDLIALAAVEGLGPAPQDPVALLRMQERRPLIEAGGRRIRPEIVEPSPVDVFAIPPRVGHPEDLGYRLGERAEPRLALAQGLLGGPTVGDLGVEGGIGPLEVGGPLADAHLQLVAGAPQLRLGALPLGDVPRDLRRAGDPAGLVLDRRDRQRHVDASAVLGQAHRLEMVRPQPRSQPLEDPGQVIAAIRRYQARDRPTDDLRLLVAVHPLGPVVPGDDRAVERLADDRVVGRLDDRRQATIGQLGQAQLVGLPAQPLVGPLELGRPLLDDPADGRVGRLDLRLPDGQVAQLAQRLDAAADQHDVFEDHPERVLQPSPWAHRRDAIDRTRPEEPPEEMVQRHDRRGRDQHPRVAVERQEGQRAEDVEVGLDPAAHQVDEQRGTSTSGRSPRHVGSSPLRAAGGSRRAAGRRSGRPG